jgi:nitroimidazol reductase NimA-like FMN-containing flavoprotein (pyridoxamine 5'-phosphate oxidase superfamily)
MTATGDGAGAPSERTLVRRYSWLAKYDRDTIYAILDAALVCQIAYVIDGQPYVTPTNFWRIGNHVHWHGSAASRMLRGQQKSIPICFSVTHLDGIVIARSAFNHNVNFRSVMALGVAELLGEQDKRAALQAFSDRLMPGLWQHARAPTEKEWRVTSVLRMSLDEVSAKVRSGPPIDDAEDYALDSWAGVIPIRTLTGEVERDPQLRAGIETPAFVTTFAAAGLAAR